MVDSINKNTLLMGTGYDYLINNIYLQISNQINKLYVVSNNPSLSTLAQETYGDNQFEMIHQSMLNSFISENPVYCCVIVDHFDIIDYNNNQYFLDILRNRQNNITLICYQDKIKKPDINIHKYFHNVISVVDI